MLFLVLCLALFHLLSYFVLRSFKILYLVYDGGLASERMDSNFGNKLIGGFICRLCLCYGFSLGLLLNLGLAWVQFLIRTSHLAILNLDQTAVQG